MGTLKMNKFRGVNSHTFENEFLKWISQRKITNCEPPQWTEGVGNAIKRIRKMLDYCERRREG